MSLMCSRGSVFCRDNNMWLDHAVETANCRTSITLLYCSAANMYIAIRKNAAVCV